MPSTTPIATLPNRALPQEAYVDELVLADEIDRIFVRGWQFVGHVSEWEKAGSFRRVQLGRHDVIVVRDRAGQMHGLRNTCRHRGSILLTEESGECGRTITCGYHAWAYGHDGVLKGAPRMGEEFDKAPYGLGKVAVETWNGLVFVCLSGSPATTVAEALGDVVFPANGLGEAVVAKRTARTVEANWKVCWENGLECYHCAINHPTLATVADVNADGGFYEDDVPDAELNYYDFPLLPGQVSVTLSGQMECARQFPGASTRSIAKFLSWHSAAFELVFSPDHVAIMTYTPVSPSRTIIRNLYLVPNGAVAGVDYDPDSLFQAHIITRDEDDGVCERVQAGISAVGYTPGPFNEYFEMENRRFLHWYQRAMAGGHETRSESEAWGSGQS